MGFWSKLTIGILVLLAGFYVKATFFDGQKYEKKLVHEEKIAEPAMKTPKQEAPQAQTRKKEYVTVYFLGTDAQSNNLFKTAQREVPEDITEDNTFKESFNPAKTYKKSLQTINELKNSYEEYKIWHKEYTKSEAKKHETFENTDYTPEELTEAQKAKDKILSAIKKLEISANNYEINADLAIHLVALASSCVGLIGGFLLSRSLGRLSC